MIKSKVVLSPFQTCPKGHETTSAEHFIYDNMNRRRCRKCVEIENAGKRRRK